MTAIKTLQKRLDLLEERPSTEPDLVEIALAALSDSDLELLHEHAVLRESGFNNEQTASMMGERWQLYLQAKDKLLEEYSRLTKRSESKKRSIDRLIVTADMMPASSSTRI